MTKWSRGLASGVLLDAVQERHAFVVMQGVDVIRPEVQ